MAIVVNSNAIQKPKIGEQIYKEQALTLKIIQMNDNMRLNVLSDLVSIEINNTIKNTMPDYLECEAKICVLNSECLLDRAVDKEVYAKSILITTDGDNYSPKELKLFCWEK